ncbi:MAG TPA: hypothetical protein VF796_03400 [Humisphaera sp.]
MNVLNTIAGANVPALLAQAPGGEPGWTLFGENGIFGTWQIILFLVLIGLVVFWVIYRKKQQDE